jgi:hypothetical protein
VPYGDRGARDFLYAGRRKGLSGTRAALACRNVPAAT